MREGTCPTARPNSIANTSALSVSPLASAEKMLAGTSDSRTSVKVTDFLA